MDAMKRLVWPGSSGRVLLAWLGALVWFAAWPVAEGAEGAEVPSGDQAEILELIRSNLKGVTDAEIDQALVQGLLEHFQPRVTLVSSNDLAQASARDPLIVRTGWYDRAFAYLRVGRIGDGLDAAITNAIDGVAPSNQLKGLILDLRFVGGRDFEAAARAADVWIDGDVPLMDWGDGSARASGRPREKPVPTVVLVNGGTSGAGEALAAVLRAGANALLVGSPTAGDAHAFREFKLASGAVVRIASAPVRVGSETVLDHPLAPDVTVATGSEEDRQQLNGALSSATNEVALEAARRTSARRTMRLNEAELVRRWQRGQRSDLPTRSDGEGRPVVIPPGFSDTSIRVALDILTGIAVLSRASGN